ncbi:hypothetical protein L0Z72_07260 [candidate division KSB1 bacterium]|nr:hypothetical protein [candidate division KSB1 bacterium]
MHLPKKAQAEAQVQARAKLELTARQRAVLDICADQPLASSDIASRLGHATLSGNLRKAIGFLRHEGFLEYTISDKPRDSRQKYRLIEKGRGFLSSIKKKQRSEFTASNK